MSEHDSRRDQELAGRARQLFTDSVAGLDGETRSRLAQARSRAIDAGRRRGSLFSAPWFVPLGGVAAAVLAVAVFWQGAQVPMEPVQPLALNDLDLLLEGEELDLFEELEFYAWLLEQPELLAVPAGQDDSG